MINNYVLQHNYICIDWEIAMNTFWSFVIVCHQTRFVIVANLKNVDFIKKNITLLHVDNDIILYVFAKINIVV